jgi:hypothetical protein
MPEKNNTTRDNGATIVRLKEIYDSYWIDTNLSDKHAA